MNTLFSSKQIFEIKWQIETTEYLMSSPMKNKHVCLYFLDGCFSSLNSASVSEFPLRRFLVTESVGDSSHPFFKKKKKKWFAVVYHNFFLSFYIFICLFILNLLSFPSIKKMCLTCSRNNRSIFFSSKVLPYNLWTFWYYFLKRFWT